MDEAKSMAALEARVVELETLVAALSDRLKVCSELLSKKAERQPPPSVTVIEDDGGGDWWCDCDPKDLPRW